MRNLRIVLLTETEADQNIATEQAERLVNKVFQTNAKNLTVLF